MPIGKIVISLEAQHAAFSKAIDEGKEKLSELGESAESIKHLIEGAFAFAGVEVGASKLKEVWEETSRGVVESYRLSGALGITTGSLQSLQTAGLLGAGIHAEEFNSILQKMTKSLGTAEEGTGPAADALARLGLAGGALKGAHVDEAFTRIAEEISKVKDPTEQARDATELFGKQGQQLLPLFQEGAEGIAKASEEARRLGIALSDTDAAKVVEAKEAMEKVGLAVDGVKNQFVVALAPVLESLAGKLLSMVPASDSMRGAITSALKVVAEGVGIVVDAWHVMEIAGQGVSWAIVGGIELITKSVQLLAEGIVWVANKLGANMSVPDWINNTQETVDAWRQQIQSDMAQTTDKLAHPESAKWGKFFDDIQAKASETAAAMADKKSSIASPITADFEENAKKIKGIIDGLKNDVATFGMSAADKKIAELKTLGASTAEIDQAASMAKQLDALNAQKKIHEDIVKLEKEAAQSGMTSAQKQVDDLKRAGASDQQIGYAKHLQDQIDAAAEQKKLMEEGKKMMEASLDPAAKFESQLKHLDDLMQAGAIDEQTYAAEIQKDQKELHKADTEAAVKKVDKVERRFDFHLPTQKHDPNDPAQLAISEHRKGNRTLEKIAKNTGKKPKVARI